MFFSIVPIIADMFRESEGYIVPGTCNKDLRIVAEFLKLYNTLRPPHIQRTFAQSSAYTPPPSPSVPRLYYLFTGNHYI